MARKKKQEPAINQYSVSVTVTFRTTWTVEATSVEEANQIADSLQYPGKSGPAGAIVDEGMNVAEMTDWKRNGDARLDN